MTASGWAARMTPAACSTSAAYSARRPRPLRGVVDLVLDGPLGDPARSVALDQRLQERVVLLHVGRGDGRRLALGAPSLTDLAAGGPAGADPHLQHELVPDGLGLVGHGVQLGPVVGARLRLDVAQDRLVERAAARPQLGQPRLVAVEGHAGVLHAHGELRDRRMGGFREDHAGHWRRRRAGGIVTTAGRTRCHQSDGQRGGHQRADNPWTRHVSNAIPCRFRAYRAGSAVTPESGESPLVRPLRVAIAPQGVTLHLLDRGQRGWRRAGSSTTRCGQGRRAGAVRPASRRSPGVRTGRRSRPGAPPDRPRTPRSGGR